MAIVDELSALRTSTLAAIEQAADTSALEEVRVAVLGKAGTLTGYLRGMGQVAKEERAAVGKAVNEVRGAVEAVLSLFDHNPARRPVLVSILGWCDGGCPNSELTEKVDALQTDNRSVYGTTTLCRMLERAGALELEMPETSEEREDAGEGVEFLEIKERIDPVWRTTDAGREVFEQMTDGSAFRAMVFDRDVKYLEVYRAVMGFVNERPRSKDDIEQLVDAFEVVQSPRRFGGHFIDMLEKTDALCWKDRSWQLTDLGRRMLPEVEAAFSKKGE